jgi:hypothetical protein
MFEGVKEAQMSLGMCEKDAEEYQRIVMADDGLSLREKFVKLQPLIDKWMRENGTSNGD